MWLVVRPTGGGHELRVCFSYEDEREAAPNGGWVFHQTQQITPGLVERTIREFLGSDWKPDEQGLSPLKINR